MPRARARLGPLWAVGALLVAPPGATFLRPQIDPNFYFFFHLSSGVPAGGGEVLSRGSVLPSVYREYCLHFPLFLVIRRLAVAPQR